MKNSAIIIVLFFFLFSSKSFCGDKNNSGTIDLKRLCEQIVDIYKLEDVAAKKERLVYKKLADLMNESSSTMKVVATDSIVYDKKEDKTVIKSKEIYYADSRTGYFGVFVIFSKKGDQLLMDSSPDKEFNATGKITDIIVYTYIKNSLNNKCFTPLKEFEDSGTIIQQVVIKVEG